MRKSIALVLFFTSSLLSSLAFSVDTYTFRTMINPGVAFPELPFYGEVKGLIKFEQDPMSTEYSIKQFKLEFEEAATLNATQTFKENGWTYTAIVPNQWLFRAVRIELDGFDPLAPSQQPLNFRVSIEDTKSYTSEVPLYPSVFELFNGTAVLERQSTFVLADVYSQEIQGKKATFRLNKNIGQNFDPMNGMPGEGAELKIMWLGHGEKLAYIPLPLQDTNYKMIAILVDNPSNMIDGEEVTIRVERNGMTEDLPPVLISTLLQNAFGI